jgi:hypothetical protein
VAIKYGISVGRLPRLRVLESLSLPPLATITQVISLMGRKRSDMTRQYRLESYQFPDDQTGWQWLYDKVSNIVNGQSSVYGQDMSIEQIAQKWAGDWENWSTNVGSALKVDPTQTSFSDYVNGV